MTEKNIKRLKYMILFLYFFTFLYVRIVHNYSYAILMTVYAVLTLILVSLFYRSLLGLLGNYYYASGNKKKADKYLKKAIDHNTKQPTVYLNYSISLMKDWKAEEALNYLEKASAIGAKTLTDKNIILAMGSCYLIMNQPEKTIEVMGELIEKYEDAGCHPLTILGYAYFIKEDMEKAVLYTEKALIQNPEYSASWDNMGQIYLKLDKIDKAKECFEKSLSLSENFADSNYFMGIIHEKLGNRDLASAFFEKASLCSLTPLNSVKKEQIDHMNQKYKINKNHL